ncbi:MAG: ISAs1 family transposase [Anaerolineales bacterium]|nr:ISAs1 family transposase [Anaerolineales bacterium]
MSRQSLSQQANDSEKAASFVKALHSLTDRRDNRGKKIDLAFTIGAVVLAIMSGRSKLSSIHRYIWNRAGWLQRVTKMPEARLISRAHLPRLLAIVPLDELNDIVEAHFGVRLEVNDDDEWTAIDSKTLCGTTNADDKQGERTLLAVAHTKRDILAQRPMSGPKTSEITAARELLQETGLEKGKVTLDALHMNPITTAQINLAGGAYIIQVKDNQEKLREQCEQLAAKDDPLEVITTVEKGHGRHETRRGAFFDMEKIEFAERWSESGMRTLIVMERQTIKTANRKASSEVSYYVSNQEASRGQCNVQNELFTAIRGHWGVESENWIRDVTFNEDNVKTKCADQAHVMACLRTFVVKLFRKANLKNFQAALETFCDCPDKFEVFLCQTGVV